jgi:site-specific recombinase XerD
MLEVLFSTGLRVSELVALDRYVNTDRGEISIKGKGGKIRVVFLSDRAKESDKSLFGQTKRCRRSLVLTFSKPKRQNR